MRGLGACFQEVHDGALDLVQSQPRKDQCSSVSELYTQPSRSGPRERYLFSKWAGCTLPDLATFFSTRCPPTALRPSS